MEFIITVRKPGSMIVSRMLAEKPAAKKTDTMNFSSENRIDLLTDAQLFRDRFCVEQKKPKEVLIATHPTDWWSSKSSRPSNCTGANRAWTFCSLCAPFAVQAYVGQAHAVGLVQVDSSGKILARYAYKDIEAICLVSSRHNMCLYLSGALPNLMHVCVVAGRPYVSG